MIKKQIGVFYASKSSVSTPFAKWFKNLLTDEQKKVVEEWTKKGYSLVFEVIYPKKDPHIISYDKNMVILLDAIKRNIHYEKMPYEELIKTFRDIFIIKEKIGEFANSTELDRAYYKEFGLLEQEGVVLEDSNEFMVKYKTEYYKKWKEARKHLQKFFKQHYIETTTLFDIELINFFNWLKTQDFQKIKQIGINIPKLRELYYKKEEE